MSALCGIWIFLFISVIHCYECDNKHYGPDCSQDCNVNCKEQICENTTGFYIYGCVNGFYLEKCEIKCSQECLSGCSRYSGECEGECSAGMYGILCDQICNLHCKNGCRREDGYCNSGCIVGKFGATCLHTCGAGCISGCNQVEGSCSCKFGWQGNNCDVCSPTHYGPLCDQLCSPVCLNGTCFSNNGSCKEGCNTNLCDVQRIEELNQASKKSISYSGFYGVIAVLLISVILNIYFITRKIKQTINKSQNLKETSRHQNSTRHVNTTVNDKVEENTGYQELGDLRQPSHYEELKSM